MPQTESEVQATNIIETLRNFGQTDADADTIVESLYQAIEKDGQTDLFNDLDELADILKAVSNRWFNS